MLLHIPGVREAAQVARLRKQINAGNWINGRETVGEQNAPAKHNRQLVRGASKAVTAGESVLAAVAANPLFFAAALPTRIATPLFNRYAGGGAYGMHVDGAVRTTSEGGRLRTYIGYRISLARCR